VITPRLRMFAGPNGSGKSTLLKAVFDRVSKQHFGVIINPDEIEKNMKKDLYIDLTIFQVNTREETFFTFLRNSTLLQNQQLDCFVSHIKFSSNIIHLSQEHLNSYFASVFASFIREELISKRISFSFETVMSSDDKVKLLKKAQDNGYRTYLYYIATESSEINIGRVENRVRQGGHNVSKEKIISRYTRSLNNLKEAIKYSNRAYIFDNSSSDTKHSWIAEIDRSKSSINVLVDSIPNWFYEHFYKFIVNTQVPRTTEFTGS
jgi:predicted ABC-type ATPase